MDSKLGSTQARTLESGRPLKADLGRPRARPGGRPRDRPSQRLTYS